MPAYALWEWGMNLVKLRKCTTAEILRHPTHAEEGHVRPEGELRNAGKRGFAKLGRARILTLKTLYIV